MWICVGGGYGWVNAWSPTSPPCNLTFRRQVNQGILVFDPQPFGSRWEKYKAMRGVVKLLEFSVFARKKCFAPMLFGKNERSVLVFPWPSLKTLAQPITI